MDSKLLVTGNVQGNFKCTWIIEKFSLLDSKVGSKYKSRAFQLEEKGMEFYFEIYPGGDAQNVKGHVSFFLHVKNRTEKMKLKLNISYRNTDGEVLFNAMHDKYINYSTEGMTGYNKTINVKDPKFKLVNDTLVAIVEVNYCISCVKDCVAIYRFAEKTPQENFIDKWRNLWKDKQNTDCVISVGGENVSAHSLVLGTHSKVFAAMFEHNTLEKSHRSVKITDFEIGTINSFLEFLYTGIVREMDLDLALDLLRASDKYEVSHLKLYCANYLMSVLNHANVCLILSSADMHNADKLRSHAIEYICEHLSEDDLEDQRSIFKDQTELLWGVLKRFVKKRRVWKQEEYEYSSRVELDYQ